MSSLVKSHNRSFLRKQESRETKEKTGFPLKNCGNDSNISNVALPLNSLVIIQMKRVRQYNNLLCYSLAHFILITLLLLITAGCGGCGGGGGSGSVSIGGESHTY